MFPQPDTTYRPRREGECASAVFFVTQESIHQFAQLSGDCNPVHLDPQYAATTPFKHPIAHGLLVAASISRVLGMDLPGPGAIYLGQKLEFKAPVYVGDTITATVTVRSIDAKFRMVLDTVCTNQKGVDVITGEALVMYRPPRGSNEAAKPVR